MNLSQLLRGESATVVKVTVTGELKKRLIDMGVTTGETIEFERNAPLGDPQEYQIKNTRIAIRKDDAEKIEIKIN